MRQPHHEAVFLFFYAFSFGFHFLIQVSNSPISSSSADLFRWSFLHFKQIKCIFVTPFLISYSLGTMVPWQSVSLSPGSSPSTCCDKKHHGQWLRQVLEAFGISFLQPRQANDSFIFFMGYSINSLDLLTSATM